MSDPTYKLMYRDNNFIFRDIFLEKEKIVSRSVAESNSNQVDVEVDEEVLKELNIYKYKNECR